MLRGLHFNRNPAAPQTEGISFTSITVQRSCSAGGRLCFSLHYAFIRRPLGLKIPTDTISTTLPGPDDERGDQEGFSGEQLCCQKSLMRCSCLKQRACSLRDGWEAAREELKFLSELHVTRRAGRAPTVQTGTGRERLGRRPQLVHAGIAVHTLYSKVEGL